MGYTIIHRRDKERMSEMLSEMLRIGGRLMTSLEELEEDDYSERRMGMRDSGRYMDVWYDMPYGERRRRR